MHWANFSLHLIQLPRPWPHYRHEVSFSSVITITSQMLSLTSYAIQQPVLMPEHRRRSDNSRIWECLLHLHLSKSLRLVERGFGVGRRVQVGDLHKALNAILCGNTSNAFSTGNMDGVVVEVPELHGCIKNLCLHKGEETKRTWFRSHVRPSCRQCRNVSVPLQSGLPVSSQIPT